MVPDYILDLIRIPPAYVQLPTFSKEASLQEMDTVTENHNWPQCRHEQIIGSPVPMAITAPALTVQDALWKGAERVYQLGDQEEHREAASPEMAASAPPEPWQQQWIF